MRINETKKSHKRPKYSIKPRNPVMPNMQSTGAGSHKDKKKDEKNGVTKHKKKTYNEHLEYALDEAILERQTAMAGVGMGNYRADEGPEAIKVLRQEDEWQVHIAGKILRISTEDAADREEAIAIAKSNLGVEEAINWANAIPTQNKADATNPEFSPELTIGDRVTHRAYGAGEIVNDDGKFIRVKFDNPHARLPDHRTVTLQPGTVTKSGAYRKPTNILRKQTSETWTHDSLASILFEQELTYEDRLHGKLKRLLNK